MLRHHPNNPRKNLGDLQELTDSIRKNGILQNLTIIPVKNGKATIIDNATEYWVLIGNRRFEAGMAAGVEEFPCNIIENLSEREQLSIMLEENIQRTDLTILEQAEGFQMMLDLGGSVESISEKTGFSQSTIYHRLNIAKLDKSKIEEKQQSFQLSISDLYELEKIKDIDTRNKILERSYSSNDIKIQSEREYRNQIVKENLDKWKEWIEKEAIEEAPEEFSNSSWSTTQDSENTTCRWLELQSAPLTKDFDEVWKENEDFDKPLKRDGVFWRKPNYEDILYFYILNENYGKISEKDQLKNEHIAKEREERAEKEAILSGLNKEFKTIFRDFAKGFLSGEIKSPEGKRGPVLTEYLWERCIIADISLNKEWLVYGYLDLYPEESEKPSYQLNEEEQDEIFKKVEQMSIQEQMILVINQAIQDIANLYTWNLKYWGDEIAKTYIDARNMLWTFGIKICDELDAFVFGEHEAYASSEED